jgi:hypothetical protein
MIDKKMKSAIALYCYAAVGNWFAGMQNPKNRGDKFTWEGFPAMMERHCRVALPVNMPLPEKIAEECKDFAAKTAKEIAQNWVSEMTR